MSLPIFPPITISQVPNWKVIDEISIPLLESGVAVLDTLRAALPTIIEADINEEETQKRAIKLVKLSQLMTMHLLKSQHELSTELTNYKKETVRLRKQLKDMHKELLKDSSRELFKCINCEKLFLNQAFLESHLQRRHNS